MIKYNLDDKTFSRLTAITYQKLADPTIDILKYDLERFLKLEYNLRYTHSNVNTEFGYIEFDSDNDIIFLLQL